MIRKIIGTILVVASAVIAMVLIKGNLLIFPHVTGPISLAVVGAILLTFKKKAGSQ